MQQYAAIQHILYSSNAGASTGLQGMTVARYDALQSWLPYIQTRLG